MTEQQTRLKNLILISPPYEVVDFVAANLTAANSASLIMTAHQALETVYDQKRALILEAHDLENIDVEVTSLPRDIGTGLTAADSTEEAVGPLSLDQRRNRILEISREIGEVRQVNQALIGRIEVRLQEMRALAEVRVGSGSREQEDEGNSARPGKKAKVKCCRIL